jgi:hypothetical protein
MRSTDGQLLACQARDWSIPIPRDTAAGRRTVAAAEALRAEFRAMRSLQQQALHGGSALSAAAAVSLMELPQTTPDDKDSPSTHNGSTLPQGASQNLAQVDECGRPGVYTSPPDIPAVATSMSPSQGGVAMFLEAGRAFAQSGASASPDGDSYYQ